MLEVLHPLIRRSPLANDPAESVVEVAGAFRLALGPQRARYTLRIREADQVRVPHIAGFTLDRLINTFAISGAYIATRLGPDEWLLHGPEDESDTLAETIGAALSEIPHALIDIGHRHAALVLEGPKAADMLNAGCPLDLAAKAFPTGSATRTLLGKAEIVLWRQTDAPGYEIECGRSFAPYVWEFLVEAGQEYRCS